jgi:glycosyltransferase involved in cell wall biosynthesis
MLVNALGGPSYSFTVHGTGELLFGGMSEKISGAAFVVSISSYGRGQLYQLVDHTHWSKVKVVHCGLETAFHDLEPVPPPAVPRFVCVGRLCVGKAQLLLVEAVHRLKEKGVELELVLAGDGEMRVEVDDLIAQYNLGENIRITGWINSNQVRDEILAARALVLPSFSEGLPVVIMEAMALRRPVLASCITGIPELVLHGENGWLFPSGSVEDLMVAMEDCLLSSPEELKKMGDAGYVRVMERHSIETEAEKLAELFQTTG